MEDNFPTVNLEAMACGTPVITFNTGGSSECIVPGVGEYVAKGDMDALIESIDRIVENEKEFYKNICREHVCKHYDMRQQASAYISVYQSLGDKK